MPDSTNIPAKLQNQIKSLGQHLSLGTGKSQSDFKELFFKVIKQKQGAELENFCRQYQNELGLDAINSKEEAQLIADQFLSGYRAGKEDKNDQKIISGGVQSLVDQCNGLSNDRQKKLLSHLKQASKKPDAIKEIVSIVENTIGVDLSKGMKGLTEFAMKKLKGFGDKESQLERKTQSAQMEKMFDSTTINTFKNGIKGMVVANITGIGVSAAGAIIPIAVMFLPALVLWDVKKLMSNAIDNPHRQGTLANPVQDKPCFR